MAAPEFYVIRLLFPMLMMRKIIYFYAWMTLILAVDHINRLERSYDLTVGRLLMFFIDYYVDFRRR